MPERRNRRARLRAVTASGVLFFALALLVAAPANAERIYESKITEANGAPFSNPRSVAVDSSDNLWVGNTSPGNMDKFAPSGTFLLQATGEGHWSGVYTETVAFSNAANRLYVSDSNFDDLWALAPDGTYSSAILTGAWDPGGFGCCFIRMTADNSAGSTGGDLYVSGTSNAVYRIDGSGTPQNFTAGSGNGTAVLSGADTPLSHFGSINNLAVDVPGHLFVANEGHVDEFAPSGAYLRTFTEGGPGEHIGTATAVASDPSNGDVLIADSGHHAIFEYTETGEFLASTTETEPGVQLGEIRGLTVDSGGTLYAADVSNKQVDVFSPNAILPKITYQPVTEEGHTFGTLNATIDLNEGPQVESCQFEFGTTTAYGTSVPCDQTMPVITTTQVSRKIEGLTAETTYHYRLTVGTMNGSKHGLDQTYRPGAVIGVTTGPAINVGATSMTLTGSYVGDGSETEYFFEFGGDTSYGHKTPIVDNGTVTGLQSVSAEATNLQSHFVYHYRFIAINEFGTSFGQDEVAEETPAPPEITGLSSAELTATTGILRANINPEGFSTNYHFEYGPTTAYGSSAPVPDGEVTPVNATTPQPVEVTLTELQPHVAYHFRLTAISQWGSVTTEDQTFNFYPPGCPNQNVRQQTQSNYLPDCRAYELVSPANAAGTQLEVGGLNTGYASSPPRFTYTGQWNTIPNTGGEPIDSTGDPYLATRTDTGWVSKYIGLPASKFATSGGPPEGPPGSSDDIQPENATSAGLATSTGQQYVLSDRGMNRFLQWNGGNQTVNSEKNPTPMASNAPYVIGANGQILDRWPTNLETVPDGVHKHLDDANEPIFTEPGGVRSLDCPRVLIESQFGSGEPTANYCPGDVTASEDLSHFIFASRWNKFTPEGQLDAPGSVYDNDTEANTVVVASKLADGSPIPAESSNQADDPLQIPAVSRDGSHILMAAGGTGPCGTATCPVPPCGSAFGSTQRCPRQPSHLYMRVDGTLTYDVSEGHDVKFIYMAPDGSKVYFTTSERLTSQDVDNSNDLYMWSEESAANAEPSLSLISLGAQGEGNRDNCSASFTTRCGVVTYTNQGYCQLSSGRGGDCRTDTAVASETGDILFFSPEQLGGSHGVSNQENLFDFREGTIRYVATFTTGSYCFEFEIVFFTRACTNTPVARMEVTPDGKFMSFVTDSRITDYDNAGYLEMYRYEAETGKVICVSCIPNGDPPTTNVEASQAGLFMANDGRVFFSTGDALVHADTNHGIDVYEYVDGRAQLITPGTGGEQKAPGSIQQWPGLVGVSATGTDVYLATFETLVRQDHNGLFLKFYDARSGGGFTSAAPAAPCEAADECHGADSEPPPYLATGTEAPSSGGNVAQPSHSGKKTKSRAHKRRRKHRRSGHQSTVKAEAGG
jgi:hypothetical protein